MIDGDEQINKVREKMLRRPTPVQTRCWASIVNSFKTQTLLQVHSKLFIFFFSVSKELKLKCKDVFSKYFMILVYNVKNVRVRYRTCSLHYSISLAFLIDTLHCVFVVFQHCCTLGKALNPQLIIISRVPWFHLLHTFKHGLSTRLNQLIST